MTNKYMRKQQSASLPIREIPIQTTVRSCLTPSEWLLLKSKIIQRARNAGEDTEKSELLSLLVQRQFRVAAMENNMEIFLKK